MIEEWNEGWRKKKKIEKKRKIKGVLFKKKAVEIY